ncbi:diacylglycerol kinase family lipid kinase [soil metagenome]
MNRWLVAVNHRAGRNSIAPQVVRDAVTAAGIEFDMITPTTSSEMVEMIRAEADRGRTHFAFAGGDGTVSLAIDTLMRMDLDQQPVLGVLPAGTGCDLLRTFGISQDLGEAARHLSGTEIYVIDVPYLDGAWGRKYFVNVAQAGVGAAAAQTAPRLSRRMGSARYPIAFAGRLPRFPKAEIKLVTERKTIESEALAVILANAQFFAGGWNVAPKATLIDGVLDVQIINTPKRNAPTLVPKVVKGTHLGDKAVRRLSVAEFELTVSRVWPVEADGDYLGNTNITGRVIPAAIKLKI